MKTNKFFKIASLVVIFVALLSSAFLTFRLDKKIFSIEAIHIEWTDQTKEYCLAQKLLCEYLQKSASERLGLEIEKEIWQIDIASLRSSLMQNNWFKMVAISRRFPNQISLSLEIEMPIALIAYGTGVFGVSENGQILSQVQISYLPELPVLKGENFFKNLSLRKLAVNFLKDVADNSELSPKNIAEISYTKDENFNLLILPSKSIVKMSADHAAIKAARVAQVIEYLNSNQLNGRVIDARFSKKVLVRLRKGS